MREEEVLWQVSTPVAAPAFPWPPYRFTDREYLNILYRTDREAAEAVVPEPLVVGDPLVRFELMKMPDVTGLGSYTECGQALKVTYGGEEGEYMHAMYVDSHPAIASGREFGAFPKKLGAPRLFVDSDTLVGTLDYGTLRVATATMGFKHLSARSRSGSGGGHDADVHAEGHASLRQPAAHLRAGSVADP